MTLGNMRELGVHGLMVFCLNPNCRHQERLDVDGYADAVAVCNPWGERAPIGRNAP